jgi:hypothetical protein
MEPLDGVAQTAVEQRKRWAEVADSGFRRVAGGPIPGDGDGSMTRLRDALVFGRLGLDDETGSVALGGMGPGSVSLQPKHSAWGLNASLGRDPMVQLTFDSRRRDTAPAGANPTYVPGVDQVGVVDPLQDASPARQYAERLIEGRRSSDPTWYRP